MNYLKYLEYDKASGSFKWFDHWNKSAKTKFVGKKAGSKDQKGYLAICFGSKKIKLHRLVWFIENGTWPKEIDHINGIKTDNRIQNLRAVDRRQNMSNCSHHREGKLIGGYWHKGAKAWVAQITIDKKNYYLGIHNTELEAHEAYIKALELL